MRFDYRSQNPVGQKIIVPSIRIHGQPIDLARTYSITVNSRVLLVLPQLGIPVQNLRELPDFVFQVVSDAVARRRLLIPATDGRMRDLSIQPRH